MLKLRVIPCLLLKHWGIEKTIRFDESVYVGSPINAARMFNAYMSDELILLDIVARTEGRTMRPDILAQIADEVTMPLAVGGGINSVDDIPPLMEAGADRVVVNTASLERPELITDIADRYGSQCVLVSIDARKEADGRYFVYGNRAGQRTKWSPVEWTRVARDAGAGEILINSVDRDGTLEGYDRELLGDIAEAVDIPVIGMGGASSLKDMAETVRETGISAVAAGALFLFFGRRRTVLINYPTHEELLEAFGPDIVRAREHLLPWVNPIR